MTVVDAWGSAGVREEPFVEPIGISMALAVSPTVSFHSGLGGAAACDLPSRRIAENVTQEPWSARTLTRGNHHASTVADGTRCAVLQTVGVACCFGACGGHSYKSVRAEHLAPI